MAYSFPWTLDKRKPENVYNFAVPFLGWSVTLSALVPISVSAAGAVQTASGVNGATLYTDTNAHTGTWNAIQVVSDATFTTFTGTGMSGFTSNVIPAGTVIYGPCTALTMSSGKVIAYNA